MTKYNPNELPSSLTYEVYIYYGVGEYVAGELEVYTRGDKEFSEGFERVCITKSSFSIPLPEISEQEIKLKFLNILQDRKKEIQAEHVKKVNKLQDKIDALLVIEHKPQPKEEDNV